MNPEPKAKWLEALRSDDYDQTKSRLGVEYPSGKARYCCLGVLCEVAIIDGVDLKRTVDHDGFVRYDDEGGVLPFKVAEWAGLTTGSNPSVKVDFEWRTLSAVNDRLDFDFNKIADVVEAQL